jgi:hypothetical protein
MTVSLSPLAVSCCRATRRRQQSVAAAVIAEAEEDGMPSVVAPRQRRQSTRATPGEAQGQFPVSLFEAASHAANHFSLFVPGRCVVWMLC